MYKRKKNGNITNYLYKFCFAFRQNKWRFLLTCWSKLVKSMVVDLLLNQRNRHKEKLQTLKKTQNCREWLKPLRNATILFWLLTCSYRPLIINDWSMVNCSSEYYCKGLVHFKLRISSSWLYLLLITPYWSTRQGTYLPCVIYL